jgi:hypothetical protein
MDSWGQSPLFRIAYDPELEPVDEALVELWSRRLAQSRGRRLLPPPGLTREWATRYHLPENLVAWWFRQMTAPFPAEPPPRMGDVRAVRPLMKQQAVAGVVYQLTHVEDYAEASMVHLRVRVETDEPWPPNQLDFRLTLALTPDRYTVTPWGMTGGGLRLSVQYLVTPPLPDDLTAVRWSLVPGGAGLRPPERKRVIDDPIAFP